MNMRRQATRLPASERANVTVFVHSMRDQIEKDGFDNWPSLAEWIKGKCDCPSLSVASLEGVMRAMGVKPKFKKGRRSDGMGARKAARTRLALRSIVKLAEDVKLICTQLGVKCDGADAILDRNGMVAAVLTEMVKGLPVSKATDAATVQVANGVLR